jgi:hypothetical protein
LLATQEGYSILKWQQVFKTWLPSRKISLKKGYQTKMWRKVLFLKNGEIISKVNGNILR